jgi:D-xylose transport system substrate-binding protein
LSKRLRTLAILAATFALAVGAQTAHAQSTVKIGFSIEAMNGERWQTDLDAFHTRAKQLGAEVISSDAKGNDDLQFQQVQDMIKAGIKTLVLLPHDATKAARMVDAAKAANVKVISYDRLVQDRGVDLYITFDRVAIGRMQAEYLVAHAPKGNYVLIAGSPNDEGAQALREAQKKVLQPYIERGDIRIVGDGFMQDWLPTQAYLFTLKAIESAHGDIAAIVASNDGMAGGAIQALAEHNLAGKVLVSGQDADLAAIIAIAQGTQAMTVYKPIAHQAVTAAEEAVRLAKGEKPRAEGTVITSTTKIPDILLQPVLVTKDNIKSTVVKDGFQTLARINQGLAKEQQIN